jgi:transposase
MPTVPRRPAAQQEREPLQARRVRVAELSTAGLRQPEVARQLGVSAQAVSVWHDRWQAGGAQALRSKGPSGPAPGLSVQQLAEVEQDLLKGDTANGFTGELWTLDRIAVVIERLTGARHHPAWAWALLRHRLGWSVQRPKRGAAERDQDAICERGAPCRTNPSGGRGFRRAGSSVSRGRCTEVCIASAVVGSDSGVRGATAGGPCASPPRGVARAGSTA